MNGYQTLSDSLYALEHGQNPTAHRWSPVAAIRTHKYRIPLAIAFGCKAPEMNSLLGRPRSGNYSKDLQGYDFALKAMYMPTTKDS
jgi:hypothetical protein